jgi:hypothetical protein
MINFRGSRRGASTDGIGLGRSFGEHANRGNTARYGDGRRAYHRDGKEQISHEEMSGMQEATWSHRYGKSLATVQFCYGSKGGAMSCDSEPEAECVTDLKMKA